MVFDNEWVIDYSASEKITLSGIWLLENGQLLELLNLGENTMKKLEIKKTEARKIHIKKVLLDSNFRIMNIISLVAFIAMVYGIIRNQNVTSDDTLAFASNLDYIIIPLLIWFVFTLIVYFTSGAHVSDMFSEVFKNFDFKFKYNIPEGAENGQVVSTGLNAENLDGVVIQTNNKMRKDIIDTALKLVGKVKYFWGGKSPKGWNSAWGKDTLVTAPGSKTTGTIRPYGLDCSGFVGWVYDTANVSSMLQNGGTNYQYANSTAISPNEAKPGDLVFNNDISHVGIYVGRKDGKPIFIECSSSKGVTISSWSGFTQYRRPNLDFGGDN